MADWVSEFNFFFGIRVRIDISISIRPMSTKFSSISTGLDSNQTNQASAGDVITSRSRDKIKMYRGDINQSAYSHQTLQDGNLPWWAPANKVTWPYDNVILQDHMANLNHYISTIRAPMAIKLGRMVTYLDGYLLIKSHYPLIAWFSGITWQTKTSISSLP